MKLFLHIVWSFIKTFIKKLYQGKVIKSGEVLAYLGSSKENGDMHHIYIFKLLKR